MRRARLRHALLLVVVAVVGTIAWLVGQRLIALNPERLAEFGADIVPHVAQHIRNFRRVKVEHGRTVWEITAKDARYFEAENTVVVQEPRMTFFLEDGHRECRVAGAEGRLALDGRELEAVTLRGGVAVRLDDLVVETEEATYDRNLDRIMAPGPVTIRGDTLDVRGRGMEIRVGPQRLRLLDDVTTTVVTHARTS